MISAYRIDNHVYLISTDTVAATVPPRTLPIGSVRLTPNQARALAAQIVEAAAKPLKTGVPKVAS